MDPEIETMIFWIRTCLVIAAICTTAFPVLYAFSPWYNSWLGRTLMLQTLSFAVTIDLTVIFLFWPPENVMVRIWINLAAFTLIAFSSAALTFVLWTKNYQRHKRKMQGDFT